jgi:DNA-binding transcriptional MerR regulator
MKDMTIEELVALTRVPERTIRHYQQHGLLPRPGAADGFLFGERHFHRLAAIQYFKQAEGLRRLDVIKAKLDALTEQDLFEFSFTGEEDHLEEQAEEDAPEPAPEERVATPPSVPAPGHAPDGRTAELLLRRVVRPGLELLVRQDAGEDVQRIAAEICAKYGR